MCMFDYIFVTQLVNFTSICYTTHKFYINYILNNNNKKNKETTKLEIFETFDIQMHFMHFRL